MITDYHAKYYAHLLRRRSPSDSLEKLGSSLLNATVDLNPHQIDAALFAFRSPLSRGALLADEVGLGKTIEAGLIISQLWAERRRRVLAIVPATLRNQWVQELEEKFFISAVILDSREVGIRRTSGQDNPFEDPGRVLVCSYHLARAEADAIRAVKWDVVVVDEAHRLRNVYKSGNKIARALKDTLRGQPKVLLTATPLQNSLLELFGLVGFLDEHLFGDIASFRAAYLRGPLTETQFRDLRSRLAPLCKRTLRRQVTEYVRYTRRIPITQDFTPTDEEQRLYDGVSAYLQRERLHALPVSQRKLMTLVLRRLLASSTFAIAGTLASLLARLRGQAARLEGPGPEEDFEAFPELVEEWAEGSGETTSELVHPAAEAARAEIAGEIAELAGYQDLAASITRNAKGQALLVALRAGFEKLTALGANRKAVIFTESRRTQEYLVGLLETNGYAGQVMTLNGTNTDRRSTAIYESWKAVHAGDDRATGNKAVDLRTALVDHFREEAAVLVATEAAAEGVNLQFCSLVVNYDLPWNPQRVEQRIGRCHRYGQKHDVVVINFLNRRNEADQRVFQLLSEKFRLFDGVFGASDEVLGALESGVDFERRIAEIYQSCRTPAEIDAAFDALQKEMEEEIQARLAATRAQLLESFDEEVHTRLRVSLDATAVHLDRLSRCLWRLTSHELGPAATFDEDGRTFELSRPGAAGLDGVQPGRYRLLTPGHEADDGDHLYRLGHPLAQILVDRALARPLSAAEVVFDYSRHGTRIALVEALRGCAGSLLLARVTVASLEREDHLLFGAVDDTDAPLDAETCERLFGVGGRVGGEARITPQTAETLERFLEGERHALLARITERNGRFFAEEIEKLERWADDLKVGLEQDIKDLDTDIRTARREARLEATLEAKVAAQRRIRELEAERNRKRRSLFEAQDEVDRQKETLISHVEARLRQQVETEPLFTIRWRVE
jgi:adenine-specific DNA-methyltransferase